MNSGLWKPDGTKGECGKKVDVCAPDDGQCTCKNNIAGQNCDKSAKCWWNFPNPEGNFDFKKI